MRDSNQTIIKFNYNENYKDRDFFSSKSNKHVLNFWINGQNGKKTLLIL